MVHLRQISCGTLAMMLVACSQASPSDSRKPEAAKTIQTGVASFYGSEFAGRQTASGERLKLDGMTAASRTLPIGTRVQVVNAETGLSTKVRINDRGPYAKGRVLDLTPRAARHIGIDREDGVAPVSIKSIRPSGQSTPRPLAETPKR